MLCPVHYTAENTGLGTDAVWAWEIMSSLHVSRII